MLSRLRPSSAFARHALTLMLGTGMAQLLPLLASPVLARLYDDHAFGVFGLFFSICSVASVVASGRYELAILLPREDERGFDLARLALGLVLGIGVLLGLVGYLGGGSLARTFNSPSIQPWLPWVAAGVIATAGYQTLNVWYNRKGRYRFMASTRTLRSAVQVGASIGLGLVHGLSGGLILGWVAGQTAGLLAFGFDFLRSTRPLARSSTLASVLEAARRYRRFPLFSVPADSVNSVTSQLPIWILGAFFTPAVIGQIFFAQRTIAAPMGLIGTAMGEVFKQRASVAFLEEGNCLRLWKKTFRSLLAIALPIALVAFVGGPWLFALVFGEEWREAGLYVRILAPYLSLAFVASPLSRVIYVAEKQSYDLVWQVVLLAVTLAALWIGGRKGDPFLAVSLYVAAYSLMYVVYIAMSYRFARNASSSAPVPA